jgi:hypothetical protein
MATEQGKFPPPPGLISSIVSGFNAVATHILVITLPVLFDLFLWFGPHLRLKQLLQPLVDQLPSLTSSFSSVPQDSAAVQQVADLIARINLFGLVRTFPVGTSSLMSAWMPGKTPLGAPLDLQIHSIISVVGWGLLLFFCGWMFGGLYYRWVAGVALKLEPSAFWPPLGQTVLLSVIWAVILFIFGIPALILFSIITVISPILAQIALIIFALLSLWVVMPIFFSPHGIFTYQQNAFHAILGSLRMTRFTLPNTGMFLLVFILIGQGLDFLWRTPPETSWLALVGIAGHAFVSTALLAASFVYYRDINAWLKAVFERLKAQATSARV